MFDSYLIDVGCAGSRLTVSFRQGARAVEQRSLLVVNEQRGKRATQYQAKC